MIDAQVALCLDARPGSSGQIKLYDWRFDAGRTPAVGVDTQFLIAAAQIWQVQLGHAASPAEGLSRILLRLVEATEVGVIAEHPDFDPDRRGRDKAEPEQRQRQRQDQ